MTRYCATVGCERHARPGWSVCDDHAAKLLQVFGGPPVARRTPLIRLSETDPFCMAIAEQKRGVRA
jgi:hypothetical protein